MLLLWRQAYYEDEDDETHKDRKDKYGFYSVARRGEEKQAHADKDSQGGRTKVTVSNQS